MSSSTQIIKYKLSVFIDLSGFNKLDQSLKKFQCDPLGPTTYYGLVGTADKKYSYNLVIKTREAFIIPSSYCYFFFYFCPNKANKKLDAYA